MGYPPVGGILNGRAMRMRLATENNQDGPHGMEVKYDYSKITMLKLLKYIYRKNQATSVTAVTDGLVAGGGNGASGTNYNISSYLKKDQIPLCVLLQQKPKLIIKLKSLMNVAFTPAQQDTADKLPSDSGGVGGLVGSRLAVALTSLAKQQNQQDRPVFAP